MRPLGIVAAGVVLVCRRDALGRWFGSSGGGGAYSPQLDCLRSIEGGVCNSSCPGNDAHNGTKEGRGGGVIMKGD